MNLVILALALTCMQSNVSLASIFAEGEILEILRFNKEIHAVEINISPGKQIKAMVITTKKGNGHLQINDKKLHIFDTHNDGAIFRNGHLSVDQKDLNGDYHHDLVITGIVEHYNDDGNAVTMLEPVTFIYLFNINKNDFDLVYRKSSFEIENG